MSSWTLQLRDKLAAFLESHQRTLQTSNQSRFQQEEHFRAEILNDDSPLLPVIVCLRPLYFIDDHQSVSMPPEELGLCMEMVSILCDGIQDCDDPFWRELYSLYGLWQGSTSSEIMGGVWVGASMMLSADDDCIAAHHCANLLLPLLFSCSVPIDREKWDAALSQCLQRLYNRGGPKSIFGHNWEQKKKKRSKNHEVQLHDLQWFRAEFVKQVFPEPNSTEASLCSEANSFIGFLSQQDGKDSQAT